MEHNSAAELDAQEYSEQMIRDVIGESVRQRRKRIRLGIAAAILGTAIACGAFFLLFLHGLPAKRDNIEVLTEIQTLPGSGWPEWVIHFQARDGKPLYAVSEPGLEVAEDGETSVNGRIVHLYEAPLGHLQPDSFTCGYSVAQGLLPVEPFDYFITVVYQGEAVRYSMREEGLFDTVYPER